MTSDKVVSMRRKSPTLHLRAKNFTSDLILFYHIPGINLLWTWPKLPTTSSTLVKVGGINLIYIII